MSIGTAEGLVEIRGRGGNLMANQDKVRELAEELYNLSESGFLTPTGAEAEIRSKLKPLLDAANDATECYDKIGNNSSVMNRLAAELEGWRKEQK